MTGVTALAFGLTATILCFVIGLIFPKNRMVFFIQTIWLVIVSSFNTMSGDWVGNQGLFDITNWTGQETIINFLYDGIVGISKHFGYSFVQFNGIFAFITTLVIVITILRFSTKPGLVLSFWYLFPFIDNIIQKRAYYAIGIIVLAIPVLLVEKIKFRQFLIFEVAILLAFQIHSFSIYYLTLPFFLLLSQKWQKRVAVGIVILGILLKGNLQSLTNLVLGENMVAKSSLYFDSLAQTASLSHSIFWAAWQITQLLIVSQSANKDSIFDQRILEMNWWGLALIPLYTFNPVFTRVFRVVMLFNYIKIAEAIQVKNWKISNKTFVIIVSQFAFLLISMYMFDIRSDLGVETMIYQVFENNWILNGFRGI